MAGVRAGAGVDAKGLEGRKEGESPAPQSRDFFWDSITLFVVGAIVSLSAIDAVSEFVRGSQVQCFFNNSAVKDPSLENVGEYVNEKCSGSVPLAQFLPVIMAVHALLILAPHYLWLNAFGASLDAFFHLASGLSRTREPTLGDYPKKNYTVSKQLDAFSSGKHRSNFMFIFYILKLIVQIVVTESGFVVVVLLLRDFSETFECPQNSDEISNADWPLTVSARCVFTSLGLLHKIWWIYIFLLQLSAFFLGVAFVWLIHSHTKELALDNVASFSFQTSLPFHHYSPPIPKLRSGISPALHTVLSLFFPPTYERKSSFYICSDYDFLLVKLFRTDGGLAGVLREVHMLRLLKEENNLELARVKSHNTVIKEDDTKMAMVDAMLLTGGDLGWRYIKGEQTHTKIAKDTPLLLPRTIRGVVLGLSALCMASAVSPTLPDPPKKPLTGALCIVFDSESVGFAGALARVFKRVALLNFSKSYSDYANPAFVHVNDSSMTVAMTTPHDIILTDREIEAHLKTGDSNGHLVLEKSAVDRFYDDFADEIWRPGFIYRQRLYQLDRASLDYVDELVRYKTDYIVIGPISSDLQRATVNMFLVKKRRFISEDAVLVTLTPLEISGVKVDKDQFPPFVPFGFRRFEHTAPNPNDIQDSMFETPYKWPQVPANIKAQFNGLPMVSVNDWVVKTGDTHSNIRFSLFTKENKTDPAAARVAETTQSQTGQSGTTVGDKPDKPKEETKAATRKIQSDTSSD